MVTRDYFWVLFRTSESGVDAYGGVFLSEIEPIHRHGTAVYPRVVYILRMYAVDHGFHCNCTLSDATGAVQRSVSNTLRSNTTFASQACLLFVVEAVNGMHGY